MSMYKYYWLPYKGKIYAALRIKKQQVAEKGVDRVETDAWGTKYNVNRGNPPLVRVREKDFHAQLTRKGKRWNSALTLVATDYAMRMREFVTLTSAPTASRLLV